jgi:predicted enzyme related to lactoylglutathione lyase
VTLPAASFALTSGDPVPLRSSANVTRTFCGRCGTPLTYQRSETPDWIDVTIASMDDPRSVAPADHTWTSHRLPWLTIAGDLPRYRETRKGIPDRTTSVLVNVDVDDVGRAVDFYQRAVGLEIGRSLAGGETVEMLGASAPVYLLRQTAGSPANAASSQPRDYGRHWTPVHLDFVVDDLEAAILRAESAGAKLEGGIREHSWGRIATVSDPFGHGLCFLQFTGRGYDEISDERHE